MCVLSYVLVVLKEGERGEQEAHSGESFKRATDTHDESGEEHGTS